jgi:hypothetical protein
MTFEEFQRTLEQMLAIQREQQERQTKILNQLIGYVV